MNAMGGGLFDTDDFESEIGMDEPLDDSDELGEASFTMAGAGEGPATPSKVQENPEHEMGRMPGAARPVSGGFRGGMAKHGGGGGGHRPRRPIVQTVGVPYYPGGDGTTVVVNQGDEIPDISERNGKKPKVRTRPMPPRLRQKWPDVVTMLITNRDGSQVLFIAS